MCPHFLAPPQGTSEVQLSCLYPPAWATTPIPNSVPRFLVHKSDINHCGKRESLRHFLCWFQAEAVTCAWGLPKWIKVESKIPIHESHIVWSENYSGWFRTHGHIPFLSPLELNMLLPVGRVLSSPQTATSSACTLADVDPLLVLNVWGAWLKLRMPERWEDAAKRTEKDQPIEVGCQWPRTVWFPGGQVKKVYQEWWTSQWHQMLRVDGVDKN